MNVRTRGVHLRRIRKTEVAWLDAKPNAVRLNWLVSIDGEELLTIEASAECAYSLRDDDGYTVELAKTAEQRLVAIVELCQAVDANGRDHVRTAAILALALGTEH